MSERDIGDGLHLHTEPIPNLEVEIAMAFLVEGASFHFVCEHGHQSALPAVMIKVATVLPETFDATQSEELYALATQALRGELEDPRVVCRTIMWPSMHVDDLITGLQHAELDSHIGLDADEHDEHGEHDFGGEG